MHALDKVGNEPDVAFVEHKGTVHYVVNLSGDILVSVGYWGKVIIWHLTTGNVIDKMELGYMLTTVAKLDDTRLSSWK